MQSARGGALPSIPVAQALGSIPPADAHLRLLASSGFTSYSFTQLKSGTHYAIMVARILKYGFFMFNGSISRNIGYTINAYEKFDVSLLELTTGKSAFQWFQNPTPFDGIVAADDAAWQGWGNVQTVLTANGEDHFSVGNSPSGLVRQQQALVSIGVQPR